MLYHNVYYAIENRSTINFKTQENLLIEVSFDASNKLTQWQRKWLVKWLGDFFVEAKYLKYGIGSITIATPDVWFLSEK